MFFLNIYLSNCCIAMTIINYTYTHIHVQYILTQWIKRLKGCVWEGVGDQTELQYIDPHSYSHQYFVFLVLQSCSTEGPGAQLFAGWWLSLPHLVSNSSDLQLNRRSLGPLLPGGGFLYHILSLTHLIHNSSNLQLMWLPVITELYNSSIALSIFGMTCLIVIKRK